MFPTEPLLTKSKTFIILKLSHMKYTGDTRFLFYFLVWQHIKKYILQFSFGHNPGRGELWSIIARYPNIFFKVWQQIISFAFGTPPPPLVIMIVPEKSLGALLEKYNFNMGHLRRNLKINAKNQRKSILL